MDTPGRGAVSPQSELIEFFVAAGEDALAHERYAEAQERFAAALRMDWNQPKAFGLLQTTRSARAAALARWEAAARAALWRRDYAAARMMFERVLAEDSARSDLRNLLSSARRKEQAAQFVHNGLEKFIADDFAGAQGDFEEALRVDPSDTVAAGYRYRAMQNIDQGAALAELRSDPDTWARYLEALQRFRADDFVAAERLWNEVLAKYPGNTYVRSNLEQVRRRLAPGRVAVTE